MTNQRLVLIETSYGTGILFDQKDSAEAYRLLCRATMVNIGRFITPKGDGEDIDIKLIAPSRFLPEQPARPMTREEIIDALRAPQPAEAPAPTPCDPSIEF